MTRSRVACSLALAAFGLGAGAASAQNVTAFNPYNGAGRGVAPSADVRGYGVVDVPPPMSGPAFNPWRPAPTGAGPGWVSVVPMAQGPARAPVYTEYGTGPSYGSGLPPPPPDAMQSRVVAIPERGDGPGARRTLVTPAPMPAPLPETPASTVTVAPPPAAPAPVPVTRAEPVPTPAPPPSVATPAPPPPAATAEPAPQVAKPAPSPPPVATTPAAPPPVAATPEPPPDPKAARPSPNEQRAAPPSSVAPTVSVLFATNSAEISDLGKSDLDRVAKTISQQRMAQVELRAFAGGADPADARKVALARALAVRSYLIDQGVKARIEVGAFAASRGPGAGERVDVLAPGP